MNPIFFKKLYANWVDYVRNCLNGCPDEVSHVCYLIGYGRCFVHIAGCISGFSARSIYSRWVSHWVWLLEERYDVSPIGICSPKQNAETSARIKELGYGS